jgi:hypothetical protein
LTHSEVATLDRLAQEQSDFIGRAISRSIVLCALVRLAETKIRPLELRNAIEEELQQGRKWGQDATTPPVSLRASRSRFSRNVGEQRKSLLCMGGREARSLAASPLRTPDERRAV